MHSVYFTEIKSTVKPVMLSTKITANTKQPVKDITSVKLQVRSKNVSANISTITASDHRNQRWQHIPTRNTTAKR